MKLKKLSLLMLSGLSAAAMGLNDATADTTNSTYTLPKTTSATNTPRNTYIPLEQLLLRFEADLSNCLAKCSFFGNDYSTNNISGNVEGIALVINMHADPFSEKYSRFVRTLDRKMQKKYSAQLAKLYLAQAAANLESTRICVERNPKYERSLNDAAAYSRAANQWAGISENQQLINASTDIERRIDKAQYYFVLLRMQYAVESKAYPLHVLKTAISAAESMLATKYLIHTPNIYNLFVEQTNPAIKYVNDAHAKESDTAVKNEIVRLGKTFTDLRAKIKEVR